MYQLERKFWNIEKQKLFEWNKQIILIDLDFQNVELKKKNLQKYIWDQWIFHVIQILQSFI